LVGISVSRYDPGLPRPCPKIGHRDTTEPWRLEDSERILLERRKYEVQPP